MSKSGHPEGEFGSSQATAEQFRTLTGLDKDTPTHVDNDEGDYEVDRYAEPEGGFGGEDGDPDTTSDAQGALPFAVQREQGGAETGLLDESPKQMADNGSPLEDPESDDDESDEDESDDDESDEDDK